MAQLDVVMRVVREAIPGQPDIDQETDLLAAGLIDSLSIIEIVNGLEGEFNFSFPDEALVPEIFTNIGSLAEAVDAALGDAAPKGGREPAA